MKDHEVILNEVLSWLDPSEAEEQSDILFELLADAFGIEDDPVTVLPFGATPKRPEGFASEAEYLAFKRQPTPMRVAGSERRSHLRWSVVPSGSALERERRGARVVRQRVEALRAIVPTPFGWTPRAMVTP